MDSLTGLTVGLFTVPCGHAFDCQDRAGLLLINQVFVTKGGRLMLFQRGHRQFGPDFALQIRLQG